MGATQQGREPKINRSLITIKIVTFFVLTGLAALHVLNSTKPFLLGLNFEEYRYLSILAPFISILGPVIVGPLADRFAAKNSNNYGKTLRILTAVVLLITSIIYACLFAVPDVSREETRRPSVSFGCDHDGAVVFQERCSHESTCHHWKAKTGTVELTNCSYTCQNPTQFENLYTPWLEGSPLPSTEVMSESDYEPDYDENVVTESQRPRRHLRKSSSSVEIEGLSSEEGGSSHVRVARDALPRKIYVEPPHLCLTEKSEAGETIVKKCHVYTDDTDSIVVHSVLRSATNIENDTHSAEWCNYPLDGFQCNIPEIQKQWMIQLKNSTRCKPMIECAVVNPYDSRESVLADSQCIVVTGNLDATLGGYFTIRILGDVFALAALTLLNTAIVIAVRETSEGRGEVCRQYAWGYLGFVLVFSDIMFLNVGNEQTGSIIILSVIIACFVLAALVLLFSTKMPLSPPEWWWHTKTGMLVYPMSAIRRYSPEIIALTIISILFGTFWGSIHNYLRWTLTSSMGASYAAVILTGVLLLNVDRFIEYCGHSNIFIAGFAIFIIRFTALGGEYVWLTFFMETIEPFVVTLIWITIIIYMRHAMPRKLTATGQALAVIAFFGFGRGFGALTGLARDERKPYEDDDIFQWLTISCSIIAVVYFIIYNLSLALSFSAKPQPSDVLSPSASQTLHGPASAPNSNANGNGTSNGNGSYSPLRVYHNERGKKGQFRF